MKSWLQDNDKKTYSIHNAEKLIINEKFNSTLTNEFKTTWLQHKKKVHIHKSGDIVSKYNNIYHSTIKM